ncbi:Na+/H+ antiporter NhaA [Francisella-like endosymbiont]|uniref:Na+/H+ antiporter NhaA n=1 Tax=Francisella-like endosymbiont TaxID=512373 RepID=UPI00296F3418
MSASQKNQELIGGLILFSTVLLAIVVNNSPLASYYAMLETINVKLGIENLVIDKNLMHWINDGLMALYFLYIGLEIKREIIVGDPFKAIKCNNTSHRSICRFGMPSLIYLSINHDIKLINGWAIPSAADIAFTLEILALLGVRVPAKLKLLVITIAIFDDIASIAIIAIFYTKSLSLLSVIFRNTFYH